jgi:hypothetical protein
LQAGLEDPLDLAVILGQVKPPAAPQRQLGRSFDHSWMLVTDIALFRQTGFGKQNECNLQPLYSGLSLAKARKGLHPWAEL